MHFAKAIIGREIIGICVKHEVIDCEDNLLDRPVRIRLKHKSKKRTGKWSEAYVNREIKRTDRKEVFYTTGIIQEVGQKLRGRYKTDFQVSDRGTVRGKQLFGECSDLGNATLVPKHSACHGGQMIPMRCSQFALCYINLFAEPLLIPKSN